MAYVIAKKYDEKGSIAFQMNYGKEMANLVVELSKATFVKGGKGTEIFSVSNLEAWLEYSPYRVIETKEEFIEEVFKL